MTTLTLQNLAIDSRIKARRTKARTLIAVAGVLVFAVAIIGTVSTIHNIQTASVLKYQASCQLYSNRGADFWYECPTTYATATTAQQTDYNANR